MFPVLHERNRGRGDIDGLLCLAYRGFQFFFAKPILTYEEVGRLNDGHILKKQFLDNFNRYAKGAQV